MRHSCGEANPAGARFCGGCGTELSRGQVCGKCGAEATPGARFCHGCGARLSAAAAGATARDPSLEARVEAVEGDLASLRDDIQGLLVLKEQLDAALKRVRQRQGGPAAGPSRSAQSRSTSAPAAAADAPVAAAPEAGVESEPSGEAPAEDRPRKVALIHIEDRPDLQDAVQAAIAAYKTVTYHPESVLAEGLPEGRPLLVVNLLAASDALGAVTAPELQLKDLRALTYVSDGTRGFVLGVTEFFPPPFDPDACATRLLAVLPASPRILVVSEAVLGTPELRAHLVRQGCTTSIAFDERQALGLIPSVRPNLVLIDLNLPRGEGLRLAGRIRAEPGNQHVRIAFLWQQAIEAALFRQYATRASFDFRFTEEDLRRSLLLEFNPGGAAYIDAR